MRHTHCKQITVAIAYYKGSVFVECTLRHVFSANAQELPVFKMEKLTPERGKTYYKQARYEAVMAYAAGTARAGVSLLYHHPIYHSPIEEPAPLSSQDQVLSTVGRSSLCAAKQLAAPSQVVEQIRCGKPKVQCSPMGSHLVSDGNGNAEGKLGESSTGNDLGREPASSQCGSSSAARFSLAA